MRWDQCSCESRSPGPSRTSLSPWAPAFAGARHFCSEGSGSWPQLAKGRVPEGLIGKADYTRLVEIANQGARELGFADTGALWRSGYDMPPDEFAVLTAAPDRERPGRSGLLARKASAARYRISIRWICQRRCSSDAPGTSFERRRVAMAARSMDAPAIARVASVMGI